MRADASSGSLVPVTLTAFAIRQNQYLAELGAIADTYAVRGQCARLREPPREPTITTRLSVRIAESAAWRERGLLRPHGATGEGHGVSVGSRGMSGSKIWISGRMSFVAVSHTTEARTRR